jgi:hypothetical protein
LLNFGFIAYIGVAAAIGTDPNPRLMYLVLLFAICSSPLLFLRKPNDRFAVYAVFCAIYFVSFGVLDVVALSSGLGYGVPTPTLSAPELLIILGGLAFVAGYHVAARVQHSSNFAANDWPRSTLIAMGLFLWGAGTYATWYWNIYLTVRAGEFNNNTGQLMTTILMLGRYAQPMGLFIIAYAYTVSRSALLTLMVIALAVFQVYLGFVSDTKGGAMLGGIMVIVTGFLVKGKIPKAWAVAGALFIVLAFPIFQAHRMFVVGERGQSNAASVTNFAKALQVSVDGQQRAAAEHAESFFQRSSVKSAVEMIVTKTAAGVPFQHGYTLIPLATSLIPRLIWPDKLDIQVGVLVNKSFNVTGDGITYISPSHLGELYWNFGWIGALAGMLLLGMLLGWINRLCDMSTGTSVTRLLILGITILQLCVRFEASIATEYAVWLRSMLAILLMHWVFAPKRAASTAASPSEPRTSLAAVLRDGPFPNLLR